MILLMGLVVIVITTFLPVGTLLIIYSRWRARPHPTCAGCGYDLTGHADAGAVCPECGLALDEQGVIPTGQVRRDTWTRAVGISMVIVGFVMLALVVIAALFLALLFTFWP